jgi:hypothetical protein
LFKIAVGREGHVSFTTCFSKAAGVDVTSIIAVSTAFSNG